MSHLDRDGALYDDGTIRLDDEGVLVRRYYFPFARARRVTWDRLKGYQRHEMSAWTGRLRAWGTHRPDWWFGLDHERPFKHDALVLDVSGVKPVITPDDPASVRRLIDERLAAA